MRRFWLTCPLWRPTEPPPPPEDQVNSNGISATWQPPQCTFVNRDNPDDTWTDGAHLTAGPATIARTYRCTEHNRRPTVHQRSWNAAYLRDRLIRGTDLFTTIHFTTNQRSIDINPIIFRPFPENWPHPARHSVAVWIIKRPAPRTMHSNW
jgi:hypothetical protein